MNMTKSTSEHEGRVEYVMGPLVDGIRYGEKFIIEYSTDDLLAAYQEHLGPCRVCGQQNDMDVDYETREYLIGFWERDRRLQSLKPVMNSSFDRMARATPCKVCCDLDKSTRMALAEQLKTQKLRKKLIALDVIPSEFSKCNFSNSIPDMEATQQASWNEARDWRPGDQSWWVLGDKGTGKTFMVRSILNQLLDQGISVGEISAVEFNSRATRKFYEWHEQREWFGKVKVLLIEDIDKAVWTKEGISQLYLLLDERHSNERRTMITTNATIDFCNNQWLQADPSNTSLPGTIRDRMKPIKRVEFTGKSLREGGA